MMLVDPTTTTVGTLFPNLKLASTKHSFQISDYLGQQPVVLHFICRFSCSRCWRSVLQLEKLYTDFRGLDFTVLVIGPGENLCPASKLARDLNIHFLMLGTPDEIHSFTGEGPALADPHFSATVLLDNNRVVRHGQYSQAPAGTLNGKALLAALSSLIARRSKTRIPHPAATARFRTERRTGYHRCSSEPCIC